MTLKNGHRSSVKATVSLPPSVATVDSWTSGSYWRNYKLSWEGQADTGDKLCLLKDVQAYGDARAAAALTALATEPVDLTKLVDDAWYWVRFSSLNRVDTEPARYSAKTGLWFSLNAAGWPTTDLEVLSALPQAPR